MYECPDRSCATCHRSGWGDDFRHSRTGVNLGETHGELDRGDCHVEEFGERPDCSACHDDDRRYDPSVGFGD